MLVQTIIQSPAGTINQANVLQLVALAIIGITCFISSVQINRSHFGNSKWTLFLIIIIYACIFIKCFPLLNLIRLP